MRSQFINIHFLVLMLAVATLTGIPTTEAVAQFPDGLFPPEPPAAPVKRERIDGENGKYKLVSRDKAGRIITEEDYEVTGSMIGGARKVKSKGITEFHSNGKPAIVVVTEFGDDPNVIDTTKDGPMIRWESLKLNDDESPRERIVMEGENGQNDKRVSLDLRKTTTWPPGSGPQGVTRVERFNRKTGRFDLVKTSPLAGKWRLEANGAKQAGEYTFAESPAISEIRQDSKVWLLMFKSQTEKRTVVVPAGSNDHLGFARKFIQLRGDAGAGRLEFWLTPDETGMNFEPTKYALVREDN